MSNIPYSNSHTHCFTIDHVPRRFFDELLGGKRFLRITNIKNRPFLQKLIMIGVSGFIAWIVGGFSKKTAYQLQRLRGLIKYAQEPTQEKLIEMNIQFEHGLQRQRVYFSEIGNGMIIRLQTMQQPLKFDVAATLLFEFAAAFMNGTREHQFLQIKPMNKSIH